VIRTRGRDGQRLFPTPPYPTGTYLQRTGRGGGTKEACDTPTSILPGAIRNAT